MKIGKITIDHGTMLRYGHKIEPMLAALDIIAKDYSIARDTNTYIATCRHFIDVDMEIAWQIPTYIFDPECDFWVYNGILGRISNLVCKRCGSKDVGIIDVRNNIAQSYKCYRCGFKEELNAYR